MSRLVNRSAPSLSSDIVTLVRLPHAIKNLPRAFLAKGFLASISSRIWVQNAVASMLRARK
jgi:hypothetical protein